MPRELDGESENRRSPSYPFVHLEEAIERAASIYGVVQDAAVSPEYLASLWGYKARTSNVRSLIAALKKFGLLEEASAPKGRNLRLSKFAVSILLTNDPEHRREHMDGLRQAALTPPAYNALFEKWGPHLPSDAAMRLYLITELNFTESVVGDFIKDYRRTLAFAQLDKQSAADRIGTTAKSASRLTSRPGTVESPPLASASSTIVGPPRLRLRASL